MTEVLVTMKTASAETVMAQLQEAGFNTALVGGAIHRYAMLVVECFEQGVEAVQLHPTSPRYHVPGFTLVFICKDANAMENLRESFGVKLKNMDFIMNNVNFNFQLARGV